MKWLSFTIPMLGLLLGLFLINKSYSLDKKQKHLKKVAVATEGVIVFGGTSKDSSSRIEYEVDGKIYSIHAAIGRSGEGGFCPVFYDPENPEKAMVNLNYYNSTRLILLLLMGILLSFVGLYGMYKSLTVNKK